MDLNLDGLKETLAKINQPTINNAATVLEGLPEKATTLIDPLSDSIYLTLPDDYARGDYLVVDVGGCDGVIFAAHEGDEQATVRVSAESVDMLLLVLGGWKKRYGEAECV